MSFKYSSIWSSGGPFIQRSRTICAILAEGIKEEQFREIMLNLDQWFRRRYRLRIFPIWSSCGPFCSAERNHKEVKDHHLNKLGRPDIQNVTYQVPSSSAFWFWRRYLKGFYHIWVCRPSWSCDQSNL